MSKTLYVEFRGSGFWAFDVVASVFLKHLIDAASQHVESPTDVWLSDAVAKWRLNAVFTEFGLHLDDSWTPEQLKTFTTLALAACDTLSERDEIPAEEIESWQFVEDERCFARGMPAGTTASAIRLGQAIIQLVNGTLPVAPPGTWWFFATEDDEPTIRKRET